MNLKVQEQILGLFAMIIIIIFNLRRVLLDSTRQTKSICMKRQQELCPACPLAASVKT